MKDSRQPRYEVKFVADAFQAPIVEGALWEHPAAPKSAFPNRVVQSIYFDDHRQRALADNLSGVSKRRKMRLRWYGENCDHVLGHLETKRRESSVGTKEALPLPEAVTVHGATPIELLRDVRRQTSDAWRPRLDGLAVSHWTRYEREYFVTFDGRVRVTLDRRLETADLSDVPRIDARIHDRHHDLLIVEVKAAREDVDAAIAFVQHLPLRPSKSSKFVLAHGRDLF